MSATSESTNVYGKILQGGLTKDFIEIELRSKNKDASFFVTVYTNGEPISIESFLPLAPAAAVLPHEPPGPQDPVPADKGGWWCTLL